ncbi:hypothetical protein LXA43DRAFT_588230 [Ganoderma leucocontextum]|nr:hypothetical protein LXA43DRAFT_588230 [Ganoderma leucocontextum]
MSESSTPLNNDILLSILSISPPKTATSIMATCSFLYHEGAKIVLQDIVEFNGSEEEALAILRFVQAEDLSRCPYVRKLRIVTLPESVAKILADLGPRMTGLKWLILARAEQMFESYPYLLPTFAALRSLKLLVITHVGARCYEMIRTLQSELVFARIDFPPGEAVDLSLAASHPIVMLKRSASTLEMLACTYLFDRKPERTFSSPRVIYPKLHTLILQESFTPNPIAFIKAFPDLTHFHVESTLSPEDVEMSVSQSRREANLELQHPSKDGQPFGWKHLQEFTGHLIDLWVLGLACRITRLLLEDAPAAHPPLVLTDVLAYARPMRLTITFENQPLTDVLGGGFLAALRSEGASSLRSLAFVIDLMAGDRHLDVGHALIDLESALSGLRLYDLLFTVCDIGLSEDPSALSASPAEGSPSTPSSPTQARAACPNSAENPTSLYLAERTLNDFDVLAFVRRLLTSIPTLENVNIGVERPGRCGGSMRIACLNKQDSNHWLHQLTKEGINSYMEVTGWRETYVTTVKLWNRYNGDVTL